MRTYFLTAIILPYYLNDFLYHYYQNDFAIFIAVNYATDLIAIFLILLALKQKAVSTEELGLVPQPSKQLIIGSIILSLYGVTICKTVDPMLYPYFPNWVYFHFPKYPSNLAHWIDLLIAIPIVAISEELVFRGWFLSVLNKRMHSLPAGLISMLVFAGIHWGSGVSSVINAFTFAILPTIFVTRYKSIYPAIIAHFVTDFAVYWNA
jgi:uncharacterized protein